MYSAELALCSDRCDTSSFRFALRTLSKGLEGPQGTVALLLNGEPLLQTGVPSLLSPGGVNITCRVACRLRSRCSTRAIGRSL